MGELGCRGAAGMWTREMIKTFPSLHSPAGLHSLFSSSQRQKLHLIPQGVSRLIRPKRRLGRL